MRLFQNYGVYPGYLPRVEQLTVGQESFAGMSRAVLDDRNGGAHLLKPVLDGDQDAFVSLCNSTMMQKAWAAEHGMPESASPADILLAQIEHHRTEVFYNLDPVRYDSAFVRRLPGSVRASVAWRAAPSGGADLSAYDLVVCNFPSILETYAAQGWRTAPFFPAHDPVMDEYAGKQDRPVDILFVGSFTRHHQRRARLLEALADLGTDHTVVMHLDTSGLTDKAESWLGRLLLPARYRRPDAIRRAAARPVYGRDLYAALSSAKIVVNGAIDMAGQDRGNMRCFEALGTGALLVSDEGNYPEGMTDGQTIRTYSDVEDAVRVIKDSLADQGSAEAIASAGFRMVSDRYSKARQWSRFQQLIA